MHLPVLFIQVTVPGPIFFLSSLVIVSIIFWDRSNSLYLFYNWENKRHREIKSGGPNHKASENEKQNLDTGNLSSDPVFFGSPGMNLVLKSPMSYPEAALLA